MKTALIAVAALAGGAAVGYGLSRQEFAHEAFPVTVTPAGLPAGKLPARKIGPKVVVVNGERHDFGTMDRNGHLSHVFILQNDGDEPLTLTKGQTTCKCTLSELGADKLPPGERAEVKLEWDAKTSDSQFEQSAEIVTNDPVRQTLHLSIVGRVIDSVRADRTDVHFHDISANESAAAVVLLHAFRDAELKIEKHELTNSALAEHFRVTFTPLTADEIAREPEAQGGQKLTIEVLPGLPIGPIDQTIQVTTNQDVASPISIRVYGNVASDILLAGPKAIADKLLVSLGTLSRSEGAKHTVYLLVKGPHRDATQMRIATVEPAAEFSATLGEASHDNPKLVRFPLTIEIPPGAASVSRLSDAAYARIHLTTTHPDVKELTIKVRYVLKD